MLYIITAGLAAWENYPTLKCMIEMVMTNNFKFPPPTTAVDDSVIEEFRSKEIQVHIFLMYSEVPIIRPPVVLVESNLNMVQVPLNETHLYRKLHFGTETSGLNSEDGHNFKWSLIAELYCNIKYLLISLN